MYKWLNNETIYLFLVATARLNKQYLLVNISPIVQEYKSLFPLMYQSIHKSHHNHLCYQVYSYDSYLLLDIIALYINGLLETSNLALFHQYFLVLYELTAQKAPDSTYYPRLDVLS